MARRADAPGGQGRAGRGVGRSGVEGRPGTGGQRHIHLRPKPASSQPLLVSERIGRCVHGPLGTRRSLFLDG
jgi:hypothetical protein